MRSALRLGAALLLAPPLLIGCTAVTEPTASPTTEATPEPSPVSTARSPTVVSSPTVDAEPACAPDAETTANIEAIMRTANTEPLLGWVAGTVDVVRATSDGYGPRPGHQAVLDFSEFLYLDHDVPAAEFDFAVPEATLADYRAGDYAEYFTAEALVARDTDGRVIAFFVNCDQRIDGMPLVPDETLLLP